MRLTVKMIGKTIPTFILALSFHVVHVKKSFQVKNRTTHFKLVHLKQKRALCPVDRCSFSCNDFDIMKVHQYDDHGIGVEARCKQCDKKFGNFRVYERHIQTCNLPKDKECPVCKRLTNQQKDCLVTWM